MEKADVIEHLLEGCETDRSRAVMVGDRRFDADGAAACGLSCIGVLYGYGVREEFLGSNVTALAQDVGELTALLLAEEPRRRCWPKRKPAAPQKTPRCRLRQFRK